MVNRKLNYNVSRRGGGPQLIVINPCEEMKAHSDKIYILTLVGFEAGASAIYIIISPYLGHSTCLFNVKNKYVYERLPKSTERRD